MSSKKSFLKQFWKEKKMVGSMIPSSRFLARKMLESVDFEKEKVIVELGPGNGVFTRKLIEEMAPDAQLFVFELNETFYSALRSEITDKRVHLIHDSAEKIGEYLEKAGCDHADVVISSLPLANFPSVLKQKVLSECQRVLRSNGLYIQFQYSLNAKKDIKKTFSRLDISFTPANFPPAFVYTARK
jgi:phosphatidylethanolamine/phosphatidyl-N-methylethanolamine N-methyltransferase